MIISVILIIAGAVYEHFSFGVYSYFMIYAFMIPLAGGALPFMVKYMRKMRGDSAGSHTQAVAGKESGFRSPEIIYHLALATLTAGSIVHGILAICGRPNSLTVIYLIAGLLLLAVTALSAVRTSSQRRTI